MTVFHTRLALLILTLVYTIRVAQRLNVRLFEPQAFFFFRAAPLLRLCCASAPLLRLEFAWAGLICNDACCVHNRDFRLQGNGFARRGRRTADIMPSSVSLHTRWFFPQHVCTLFFFAVLFCFEMLPLPLDTLLTVERSSVFSSSPLLQTANKPAHRTSCCHPELSCCDWLLECHAHCQYHSSSSSSISRFRLCC